MNTPTNQPTATPTPWKLLEPSPSNPALASVTANTPLYFERHRNVAICPGPEARANAALIVEAVNNYAALQERMAGMQRALEFYANGDSYCRLFIPGAPENHPSTFAPVLQDDGKLARTALAEAARASKEGK